MTLRYCGPLVALFFVIGVRTADAQCTATVTPTTVSVSSIGSTSSLSVVSGTNCTWTAVSNVSWITVTSFTGSGIGQVNYTVAANTSGAVRTGTMTVAGQTVTFTQSANNCTYSVTPTSVNVSSIGSTSALSVVSGTSCSWTPVSNVSWITVNSFTGAGIGQVNYTVAANTSSAVRSGTITVGGVVVTFTQAANSCSYSVTPTSVSVSSIGSTSALSVVSGTSCSWSAVSSVGWITITSATGSGVGQVNYVVAENTSGAVRTGTVTVGGIVVTFTQAANSCSYSVTPTSVSVSSIGSTSALSVTSGTSCSWTAVSNVSWITITSATGSGIGQVNYTVAGNTSGAVRTGTVTVGGIAVTFTQDANSCSYSVTPTSVSVPSTGSTSAISVTSGTSCSWTAVSNVSWITITSATGSGLGQVNYVVAENTTGAIRTGTVTVGGIGVAFTQAANSCSYSVTPTSVSVPSTGSTSAISVTSGTSCSWTAVSGVSWITITSGASGTGIGAVNYTVAANTTGVARTGTMTVAGQMVTFTQAASSCSYTVTPTSVSVPSTGSTSALSVSTGTSCSWTAVSNVNWITITSGASGSGIGTVNYTVAANPTTAVRTGTVTVAGQTVTFTQAASCSYTVTPTTVAAPANGTSSTISVTSNTGCSWTATSSVSWITITSGASGSGNGSVGFTVAANTTTTQRSGTLMVAGQTVSVTQAAQTPPSAPTNLRIIK
jgi:hypothetical protein